MALPGTPDPRGRQCPARLALLPVSLPATVLSVLCPVPSRQLPPWADDHHSFIQQTIFSVCFAPGAAAHRLAVGGREVRDSKAAKEANAVGAGVPRPAGGLSKASRSPHPCPEMLRELGWEA